MTVIMEKRSLVLNLYLFYHFFFYKNLYIIINNINVILYYGQTILSIQGTNCETRTNTPGCIPHLFPNDVTPIMSCM